MTHLANSPGSWSLGICVPKRLLGSSGYLAQKQQNIETIRLVTDGKCRWAEEDNYRLYLTAFPHLKSLSCKD